MDQAKVAKIRPVSWTIAVPGKDEAEYVRSVLTEAGIQTSQPQPKADLMENSKFVF